MTLNNLHLNLSSPYGEIPSTTDLLSPFGSQISATDLLSPFDKFCLSKLLIPYVKKFLWFCRCGFSGVVCFYNRNVESIQKKDVILGLFRCIVNTFARYLDKKV